MGRHRTMFEKRARAEAGPSVARNGLCDWMAAITGMLPRVTRRPVY